MAKVISLINLKGGVGKTTLTIALAEFLALDHKLKTLVIDLDPQANATACLMDLTEWKRRNMRGQTIMRLFMDCFQPWTIFSISEARVKNASNINGGIANLDLIPSGNELMDLQDNLLSLFTGQEEKEQAIYLLQEVLSEIKNEYDIILIDCPPSLGLITQNGLAVSDYYIIPVIPETMSLHGIPQIVSRVNRFNQYFNKNIRPLGLVITRYREQNPQHQMNIRELQAGGKVKKYGHVFDAIVHESATAANAVEFSNCPSSLSKKYGPVRPYKEYQQLTREVLYHSRD